jgi:class 3 adenylate cyclase
MARLAPRERAELPDRQFAYVDSRGRRRLPLHDAAHVRNALARFSQVQFEDDAARDRARTRLLQAAKRFRIVPIGFIAGQLRSERESGGRAGLPVVLPSGFVTMLMTDIEGSTGLVQHLGEAYGSVLDRLTAVLRGCTSAEGGHEVESRADEFFAVFASPRSAVDAAVDIQRSLLARTWDHGLPVRVRIGVHSGYPTSRDRNYIGMDVHATSRICAVGHGGQVVVSANTREAVRASAPDGVRFRNLGSHRLRGLPEAVALYQLGAKGLPTRFPPLRMPSGG